MSTETIYIAGRYNKYSRDLSQSPWIDKNDVRVKDSVQEMLEDGLRKFLTFEKSTFTSSGREDVDVRMLGKGRPFAFKIMRPIELDSYNDETFRKIELYVNEKCSGMVGVRDLQLVSKADVAKYLKEGQESKSKEYRALCCCSRRLTRDDFEKINKIVDLCLEQLTPIRVLHRRTLASRRRTIHRLKIEPAKIGEFDSVKSEHLDRLFALTLLTEAGTYIKEFVHGDFGRTTPNLSSLLGDCETDLMELDVTEVHLDWPPVCNSAHCTLMPEISSREDKMENSDAALADLYEKGYKSMQNALEAPRGDRRNELLVEARRSLEKSKEIVESLSLFSDNETLEDISTVNLKYLLIPVLLAKITLSSEIQSRRLEAFLKAKHYIGQFLQRISSYGLGDKKVDRVLVLITQSDDSSKDASPTTDLCVPTVSTNLEDQMRARAEKIEMFRKTRELEQQLEVLNKRMEADNIDDEVSRDYYTRLVQKWILDALEDYERIVEPGIKFETSNTSIDDRPATSRPTKSVEPKTFTIVRDQLQKKAFGIGYPSLPTVSVDEFISKKINDGDLAFQEHKEIYANSLQRYAEKPDLRREQEEQSDEEHELKAEQEDPDELARKRAWDEFKDENPRGSGNRYNMG